MIATQNSFQPAIVTGLNKILKEGDVFTAHPNHIDYPNTELTIPKGCIGFVEFLTNNQTEGTVSVLWADTITARRLMKKALDENQ